MASGGLHSGHRDRLRKRFLETDGSGFEEHELLELLLFYALPRVNTNELSHALINRFGSLSAVLNANEADIASVNGISAASASFIGLMRDLCRSYALSSHENIRFGSSAQIEKYMLDYFLGLNKEIILILSISMKCELISVHSFTIQELLPEGMSSRRLTEIILQNKIHRAVIGQNRIGRLPVPDENDYLLTKRLSEIMRPLGVELYDHIICGSGNAFSMRKNSAFSFCGGGDEFDR